jgi:signal transduction histidine kinase
MAGRMPISGSGDELDRLSKSLNDMLDQIERLMQGLHEVSSNVAHDLRTPLTRLRARIEAALRQDNKRDYKAALQQTLSESDALLSTFNALMSLNQLDSGQLRSALVEIDLAQVLHDVVELYEPVAEEQHGKLQLACQPGLMVRGKRELLAQAFINLIDNALKYGQSRDGTVRIKVEGQRRGTEVVVAVSDHGPGIPLPDRERVLKRFVRLDLSRSKPGNGLGLSLVASVANLVDGKLLLMDNKPGLRAQLQIPASGQIS